MRRNFKRIFSRPFKSRGVKLLLQVKRIILDEPKRIDMTVPQILVGTDNGFEEPTVSEFPPCGTVGCIAGWTVAAADGGISLSYGSRSWGVVGEKASKLLELTYQEREVLFYDYSWPSEFRDRYNQATTAEQRAQVTADRIDYFIANRK